MYSRCHVLDLGTSQLYPPHLLTSTYEIVYPFLSALHTALEPLEPFSFAFYSPTVKPRFVPSHSNPHCPHQPKAPKGQADPHQLYQYLRRYQSGHPRCRSSGTGTPGQARTLHSVNEQVCQPNIFQKLLFMDDEGFYIRRKQSRLR